MKIAVVIPCFKVGNEILSILNQIGPEVNKIYLVDDYCPLKTGQIVRSNLKDSRIELIFHELNMGVGAAVKSGYRAALKEEFKIIVKLDGDGQMDPKLIPKLIAPILAGSADYVKGNRFHTSCVSNSMPPIRRLGNKIFSAMCRLATGVKSLHDVLNGFTAISTSTLQRLDLNNIADDYFFESDMIISLAAIGARFDELPMEAVYKGENSSLSVLETLFSFPPRYLKAWISRVNRK